MTAKRDCVEVTASEDARRETKGPTIPADRKSSQRQIEATDEEIDALVYGFYGLTEEEIAIVEERDH